MKNIFFNYLESKWKRLVRVVAICWVISICIYYVFNGLQNEILISIFISILTIFLISYVLEPFVKKDNTIKNPNENDKISIDKGFVKLVSENENLEINQSEFISLNELNIDKKLLTNILMNYQNEHKYTIIYVINELKKMNHNLNDTIQNKIFKHFNIDCNTEVPIRIPTISLIEKSNYFQTKFLKKGQIVSLFIIFLMSIIFGMFSDDLKSPINYGPYIICFFILNYFIKKQFNKNGWKVNPYLFTVKIGVIYIILWVLGYVIFKQILSTILFT
jgi:hypothetical protein